MSKNDNPIHKLFVAACEIVDKTRQAFRESGQNGAELRLPIVMQGTDIRVVIEAGPSIAARNAMETAHGRATGAPLPDRAGALRDAIRILSNVAKDVEDDTSQAAYIMQTVRALELECER